MLVGQLLRENLGRQRAAGQFAAGYCMFAKHTIATPTPKDAGICHHHHGSCERFTTRGGFSTCLQFTNYF